MNRALALVALLVGLVLPTALPEVANIGFFVVAGLGVVISIKQPAAGWPLRQPAVALPVLALALLALAFSLAGGPSGGLSVVYLAPFLVVGPFAMILSQGSLSVGTIALAALGGSAIAAAIGVSDGWYAGIARAGAAVNNPIHFGALAACLGFVALVGIYDDRRWIAALSATGPLWGSIAAWFSGSRGPLAAIPAMLLVVLFVLAFQFWPRRRAMLLLVVTVAAIMLVGIWGWVAGTLVRLPAIGPVVGYLQNGVIADSSSGERLAMYGAGLRAFLASPWFGHGLQGLMPAAQAYASAGVSFDLYDHLHSDIIDFAVMGGVPGLLAYGLLLIAAPIQALWRSGSPDQRPAVLVALPLATGYLIMGVTNAMIGILTQTMLLAVVMALCLSLTGKPRNS